MDIITSLTEREYEAIRLVIQGLTNKQIAQALNIQEVTVEKTLQKVYKKLDVTNRIGAIIKLSNCT